ncbi:AraC family transcriptional regulator [Sphingobium sp. H39-3-25]|uniref:helix-turn-helix domain-containing protein n=1 Tax=Sphingobium arseniciresistens TaxID=3030834 RepID=UPI0023B8ADF8|nr:AraC family transcriptional regulator [Sphingobium arseniciresistens]
MIQSPIRTDLALSTADAQLLDLVGKSAFHCVLHAATPRPDSGWYIFLFDLGAQGVGCTGDHLTVAYLRSNEEVPDCAGAIVGLVHEDLMSCWWGTGEAVPPIVPGSYFLTASMETLVAATAWTETVSPAARLRAEAQMQELLCETMDAWRSSALVAAAGDMALHREERERLSRARKMIETQFADKITIEGLARSCGLGRARLIRGFKLLFGQTVAECLAERRLQAAASALKRTRQPVSQIAFQSGYLSNAAFTRAFARRFGTVPSAFRAAPLAA